MPGAGPASRRVYHPGTFRILIVLCLGVFAACSSRPVELGFWMSTLTYQSPRIGEPITAAEFALIDKVARAEIAGAFKDFDVVISARQDARFNVGVVPQLKDWRRRRGTGSHAGESRVVAGFGGSGSVNFEFIANGAMVFSPEDASRTAVIDAVGRGIGRVAIHEFLHQLLPKQPIHDSKDVLSYEGNSPALVEGYFGELHWDMARPWLNDRLKRR